MKRDVLDHHVQIPLEHRILWQLRTIDFEHLFPIDGDLVLFAALVVGLGLSLLFARGQIRGRVVASDLGLALFSLESIDLIVQLLDFFGLLLTGGLLGFHQVHQIDDHLAHTFFSNGGGIEVF